MNPFERYADDYDEWIKRVHDEDSALERQEEKARHHDFAHWGTSRVELTPSERALLTGQHMIDKALEEDSHEQAA